jgi:hypothetical protein
MRLKKYYHYFRNSLVLSQARLFAVLSGWFTRGIRWVGWSGIVSHVTFPNKPYALARRVQKINIHASYFLLGNNIHEYLWARVGGSGSRLTPQTVNRKKKTPQKNSNMNRERAQYKQATMQITLSTLSSLKTKTKIHCYGKPVSSPAAMVYSPSRRAHATKYIR